MDGFFWMLLSLGIWVVVVSVFSLVFSKTKKQHRTIASDGHVIAPENDITCEGKEGHVHPQPSRQEAADYGRRYIVHDDPEVGYVVLNGVKRRISDCRDL